MRRLTKEEAKQLRLDRRAAGVCTFCGESSPKSAEHAMCINCLNTAKSNAQKRRNKRGAEYPEIKQCTKCERIFEKPVDHFWKDNTVLEDGLHAFCKYCGRKERRLYDDARRDEKRRLQRRYSLKAALKRRSVTFSWLDQTLKEQNFSCAICLVPFDPFGRHARAIDHNHKTGQTRGLLCRHCNSGIGLLEDSPEILERAAAYLRLFSEIAAPTVTAKLEITETAATRLLM